jgi:alkylhydroperoxidase family enzyme
MLRYVLKLTRTPAEMAKSDVEGLRTHGLSDDDVLAIVEVAAYFAYANRIADGLGIELEK